MNIHEMYALLVATAERTDEGCLLVTKGSATRGYRKVWADGRGWFAHRLAMEVILGRPLLPGRAESVDHECHNASSCDLGEVCPHRRCIERTHLSICDQTENWKKGRLGAVARRRSLTHCPQGHRYTSQTSAYYKKKGWRRCNICHRDKERERRATAS